MLTLDGKSITNIGTRIAKAKDSFPNMSPKFNA